MVYLHGSGYDETTLRRTISLADHGPYPDFTREGFLAGFAGVSVLVHHRGQDGNAPFEQAVLAVETET